jgi:hypothetical protein
MNKEPYLGICFETPAADYSNEIIGEEPLSTPTKTNYVPTVQKQGMWKYVVAVILGIIVGFSFRFSLVLPLSFMFATDNGLPSDIEPILEYVSAFVAGSFAGSLAIRFGWLIGTLTQIVQITITSIVLSMLIYFSITDSANEVSVNAFLGSYIFRIIAISAIFAGIGGHVGQKYRSQIWNFLTSFFSVVGSICGFIVSIISIGIGIYFVYLGGKAIFEEKSLFKGLLIIFVASPLIYYLTVFVLGGIMTTGVWIIPLPIVKTENREF